MVRYLYFTLVEAAISLWRSRILNLLSIGTVMFAMFILGSFIFVGVNLKSMTIDWRDRIQFNVFLKDDITPAQLTALKAVLNGSGLVTEINYISKIEARKQFGRDFGAYEEVLGALDDNPFPASFQVSLSKGVQRSVFDRLKSDLERSAGVEEIYYDEEVFTRLTFFANLIQLSGWFFGSIMIFSSIFTISNVLKLTFFTRREEVDIMKLVGASKAYIRGPFIVEGVLIGVLGAFLGIFWVYLGYLGLDYYLGGTRDFLLGGLSVSFLSFRWVLILIGCGGFSGLLGSLFSLHQFLEEHISYH